MRIRLRREKTRTADDYMVMMQTRRILMWLMLIMLAALVSYVGFRGYMSPELLINFANSFYC